MVHMSQLYFSLTLILGREGGFYHFGSEFYIFINYQKLHFVQNLYIFKTSTCFRTLPFKNHKTFCHFDATLAIDHKAHNKMKGGGSFPNLGCGVFHEFSSPWFIHSSFSLQLASIAFFF